MSLPPKIAGPPLGIHGAGSEHHGGKQQSSIPKLSGIQPMTPHALIPAPFPDFEKIQAIVVDAVRSLESKRAYRRAVADFLRWHQAVAVADSTRPSFSSTGPQLENAGLAPSTINLKLTAVRRLAAEAADNGLLAPELASGIARVKGVRSAGVRTGHWLTRNQTEDLVQFPTRRRIRVSATGLSWPC